MNFMNFLVKELSSQPTWHNKTKKEEIVTNKEEVEEAMVTEMVGSGVVIETEMVAIEVEEADMEIEKVAEVDTVIEEAEVDMVTEVEVVVKEDPERTILSLPEELTEYLIFIIYTHYNLI